jgi:hypothetical protein
MNETQSNDSREALPGSCTAVALFISVILIFMYFIFVHNGGLM